MNTIYTVADISFELPQHLSGVWGKYQRFECERVFKINKLSQELLYGLEWCNIKTVDEIHIIQCKKDLMFVDKEWRNAYIFPDCAESSINSFVCQLFYTHIVPRKFVYFHSALVEYKDQGILFLGPSGIGKTTQAELWNNYRNALIINGDRAFVQETADSFLGWGTPWHGSSPYCENASVPVHAMVVLKQSSENSIRELTGFEKVTAVSTSVFYPRWLENGMELCLETLDHFLSRVPVYELSCRPDEDAVKLTEEAVFGSRL